MTYALHEMKDSQPGTCRMAHACTCAGMRLRVLMLVVACTLGVLPSHAAAQSRVPRGLEDVLHYAINVRFDIPARAVHGVATVTVRTLQPQQRVVRFDAAAMNIMHVRTRDGADLAFTYDSAAVTVDLGREHIPGDTVTVRIEYACTPERGLYFIVPGTSYPADPLQIWTQGQPEDNRHWFPCYDFPDDKSTSEVTLTVPDTLETLSNGVLVSRTANGDGTATWHWSHTQPHSSYLVMLAAGRYGLYKDAWDGIPVTSYHYPADDSAAVRRTYGTTAQMVGFFSSYFGIRYPWSSYAQIPVRRFMFGGMENTTATVMADSRMVVDARAAIDYSAEPLIAHELAHQWWGDDVTNASWEHSWLNEGFATYFQQLWTLHAHGADDFEQQRTEGIDNYIAWCDRNGPVPLIADNEGAPANAYSKGAAVLHMLRTILGDETFRACIRQWGVQYARRCAVTEDFERLVDSVAHRDLGWFFRQWVHGGGYPKLEVARSWDAARRALRLHVRQTQDGDGIPAAFRLPVDVLVAGGSRRRLVHLEITSRDTVCTIPLSVKPRLVEFDHGRTLCASIRVELGVDEWLAELGNGSGVSARTDAAAALIAHAEQANVRTALFRAACGDPSPYVRTRIASLLAAIKTDTLVWKSALRDLLLQLARDAKSTVRSNALNGLRGFHDASLRPVFERALGDSSVYVEAAAMNCLLDIDPSAMAIVRERLRTTSYQDVLALAALDWVKSPAHAEVLPELRMLAGPGHSYEVRMKALQAISAAGVRREELRSLLVPMLAEDAPECRMVAIVCVARLLPAEAAELLASRLRIERDKDVGNLLERVLRQR